MPILRRNNRSYLYPSWTTSYAFRSQFSALISVYLSNMKDASIRVEIGNKLTDLVKKYCPYCKKTKFALRRQLWKDLYPGLISRLIAYFTYNIFKRDVITDVRWYHLFCGYKMWVRFDFSSLSASDFASLPVDIMTMQPEEASIIAAIEKNVKLRPAAYLKIPDSSLVCEMTLLTESDEEEFFFVPLSLSPLVVFVD